MKVFALAPQENWIVDRIVNEWNEGNKDIYTTNPPDADVIWLVADWCWKQLIPILKHKKVVVTVHHVVPNKFLVDDFILRDDLVDKYHCPNKQTADFIRKYTNKPIQVIPYWINDKLFFPDDSINQSDIKTSLNIPENSFLVGSFQRDTEGHDLKSPKLEKGPDLFCDAVEKLTSKHNNLHVLLGGWRRQYVINRLQIAGIHYSYFERPPLEKVIQMYRALDLYLVTSRYEGGPQAILEAAALKVPIVSTPVGFAGYVLSQESISLDVTTARPNLQVAFNNVSQLKRSRLFPIYRKMFEI